MATTTTYCLEGLGNTRIALSQEDLRQLVCQAEADLHHSETYQRAMTALQQEFGEAIEVCQPMLRALGREAMRLVLRLVIKRYRTPSPDLAAPVTATSVSQPTEDVQLTPSEFSSPTPMPTADPLSDFPVVASHSAPSNSPFPRSLSLFAKKSFSPEAQQALLEQERETQLRQIGQQFKQARESKSLSLEQLYYRTKVPLHHLRSLETGRVDQLPEDIYVRGFIRRIADELELDVSHSIATLPVPERAKAVVPSWQISDPAPPVRSMYVYLGYITLVAGAIGGLNWIGQQNATSQAVDTHRDTLSESVSQSAEQEETNHSNSYKGKIINPVSPPEILR